MIALAALNQTNLFVSVFNFFTNSGILFLILIYGKSSPITPVDANNKSVIFTTSLIPLGDCDDLIVRTFDNA